MSKGGQIAIAVLSVFAALAWVVSSTEGTYRAFESVSEMRLALGAASDPISFSQDMRVQGFVVEGSIQRDLAAEQVSFSIHDTPTDPEPAEPAAVQERVEALPVVYLGIDLPDLFRDGAQVVVEGRLQEGIFQATRLMAKCPSKYENAPVDGPPAQVADLAGTR